MAKTNRIPSVWLLLGEIAAGALVCALLVWVSLGLPAEQSAVVYDLSMWALIPLAAFFASFFVVRLGLNAYLGWFAFGVCQICAHFVLTGLLPSSPGMPMVSLLMGLIGAASGEVYRLRNAMSRRK